MADAGSVRIAGKRVQDQNGVGLGGVQLAIGFVSDVHGAERPAAIKRQGIEPDTIGLDDHQGRFPS